jgi:hypothetical protein
MRCANCDKIGVLKTVYGDWLCEDCWDEYICTKAGMLEHLIGICKRDYPIDDYDADFLGEVAKSWRTHATMLDFTPEELTELEQKAIELGIL